MAARIEVTMTDEQTRRVLDNQRKAAEKVEAAHGKVGRQVEKNEKAQIRAANAIIKKQRSLSLIHI